MPTEAVVADAQDALLEEFEQSDEPRPRGGSSRAGIMKPFVVLALPGMYLFYKYSQYRREQRELSRRRVTERELQHLHHKIVRELMIIVEDMEFKLDISAIFLLIPTRYPLLNMGLLALLKKVNFLL